MDKELLLKEARERYPIGTKFKSVFKDSKGISSECIVEDLNCYWIDCVDGYKNIIQNDIGAGWLYCDGVWATIISLPSNEDYIKTLLKEAESKYPTGTVYRELSDKRTQIIKGNFIHFKRGESGCWAEHSIGDGHMNGLIYQDGKWAKIISKPKFILPEKWCVKVEGKCSWYPEFVEWRGWWNIPGYIHSSKLWSNAKNSEYTEITYEQFLKYVYKKQDEEMSKDKIFDDAEAAYQKLMTKDKQPVLPKLEVGRLVKLKSTRQSGWNSSGQMDHYCGKVVRIIDCTDVSFYIKHQHPLEGNGYKWSFNIKDIADWNPTEPEYRPDLDCDYDISFKTCIPNQSGVVILKTHIKPEGYTDCIKEINPNEIIIPKIIKKKEIVTISLNTQSYPVTIPTVKRIK